MNNAKPCAGQIWEAANPINKHNYYQWRLVGVAKRGFWFTDVRKLINGKPMAWRMGAGVLVNPLTDELKIVSVPTATAAEFAVWPPKDGAIWRENQQQQEEIYFTGRLWNPAYDSETFEFYRKNGERNCYNKIAVKSGALRFVRYNPINWNDYLPPATLLDIHLKTFKPGQVWATRFHSSDSISLVWRVHKCLGGQSVDAIMLAQHNVPSQAARIDSLITISNSMYIDPAVLVADSGCEPPDPDLIYQFLYK